MTCLGTTHGGFHKENNLVSSISISVRAKVPTFHDRSNACNLLADILEEREVSELLQKGEALSNGCSQITLGGLISALPSYSQLMMGHTFCVPIGQEQAVVEEFLLMAT